MKPRVLFVGNFLSGRSGIVRQASEDLAERLSTRGYTVITTSARMNRVLRLFDMLKTVWMRRLDYDVAVVDVFSWPSFLWAEATGRMLERLGKPFVFVLHGGGLPEFAFRWPNRVRRALSGASRIVSPSKYLAEGMASYRKQIVVIPNGIDLDRYPFRLRANPTPSLVWLRAFHRIYDPFTAVRVAAELRHVVPDIELTLIGPDKGDGTLGEVSRLVASEGFEDRVRIVPGISKEEVPSYLADADVLLNTPTIDNTPVSVIEAMACGLCVVSTDAGGLRYLIDDGEDGLLVPVGDARAMAEAVIRLIRDPNLSARVSENARKKAEQFDWGNALGLWDRLLREVAGGSIQRP